MRGSALTDHDHPGDGDQVPTLQQLIQTRRDERGWTYADLAERSGGNLTRSRWQQLGSGARLKSWPEPATIHTLVDALGYDYATVVLACAQSLGLPVGGGRGPLLAQLIPAGADLLTDQMRDAILAMIRAAVADALGRPEVNDPVHPIAPGQALRWPAAHAPSRAGGPVPATPARPA